MSVQIFSENLDISEAQADSENRVLRNVILIRAGMSLNRRHYSEAVLEKAVNIFQDSRAYDNHVQGPRSIRDITGFYKNVRYESGALKADRYFTKNQAGQDAWAIASEVVSGNAPRTLAGLSINALGKAKKHATEEGALEIESITAAISIDDVPDAAAKGSYVENAANDDLTQAFWESVEFEQWRDSRPDYFEKAKISWQTTRKSDELAAALAESERLRAENQTLETFKTAKADTEALQTALDEAQTQVTALQAERDTAVLERDTARRELAVERAVSNVPLPKIWTESLRQRLAGTPETGWKTIIEDEIAKAKAAGHRQPVSGAGQQVHSLSTGHLLETRAGVPVEVMSNYDEWLAWRNAQLQR